MCVFKNQVPKSQQGKGDLGALEEVGKRNYGLWRVMKGRGRKKDQEKTLKLERARTLQT